MSKNKLKINSKIKKLNSKKLRLTIFRSNKNISAQIIDDQKNITLVAATSLKLDKGGDLKAARQVGEMLAANSKKKKISDIYFCRGSFKYEGRIKALCEAAREKGLKF